MNLKANKNEIVQLIKGEDDKEIFSSANRLKEKIFGKEIYIRGIVEFSNVCREKCLYCGLRAPNKKLKRYRLKKEEILEAVELVEKSETKTVVLQSGDDFYYKKEFISDLIKEIKKRFDLAITLSLGERKEDELKEWRDSGAERYLLKVETFNEKLYSHIRPGKSLSSRLRIIDTLFKLGYEVGSGIIVGLPQMTDEILGEDLLKLSEYNFHMLAVGPFIPNENTPFGKEKMGNPLKSLRAIAILRLLNPYSNIPSTSALGVIDRNLRIEGLKVGANVIMPSFTPKRVRVLYNIYPGKNETEDSVLEEIEEIKKQLLKNGLIPSKSKGSYFEKYPTHL